MNAKLIFNPASGDPTASAVQLMELLRHLQTQRIEAQIVIVEPGMPLSALSRRAARDGAKMVIVAGGDGTIENVALGLVGSTTTLGIIPTGTRNNLARSLNIPIDNIAAAAALLRKGRRVKIDVGLMRHRRASRLFLEAGAIGLASALYPSADEIQHGDLGKIVEFISTFVSHTPSEIRLRLDDRRDDIVTHAHLVLIANMPYMGANFQVGPNVIFDDRHLDVFVYSELSKLDLIGQAIQAATRVPDARIQRLRVKKISITTNPAMPVMADGVSLAEGDGPVTVTVQPGSLVVMAGPSNAPVLLPSLDAAEPETSSVPPSAVPAEPVVEQP